MKAQLLSLSVAIIFAFSSVNGSGTLTLNFRPGPTTGEPVNISISNLRDHIIFSGDRQLHFRLPLTTDLVDLLPCLSIHLISASFKFDEWAERHLETMEPYLVKYLVAPDGVGLENIGIGNGVPFYESLDKGHGLIRSASPLIVKQFTGKQFFLECIYSFGTITAEDVTNFQKMEHYISDPSDPEIPGEKFTDGNVYIMWVVKTQ